MHHHSKEKFGIIYPESKNKSFWDLFMTVVLLVTCFLTPLDIAFDKASEFTNVENASNFSSFIDLFIDVMFFIDILVIFNSAYYDDETELVDDRKEIAK